MLKAQAFLVEQAEESRWDCAGEAAYNVFYGYNKSQDLWDHLTQTGRGMWIAVAKAVIANEG